MGAEPVFGSSIDRGAHPVFVDAIIVPVHYVVKVVESQTPGGIHRFVGYPRGESAFSLEDKDPDSRSSRPLEGESLACGCRTAMA